MASEAIRSRVMPQIETATSELARLMPAHEEFQETSKEAERVAIRLDWWGAFRNRSLPPELAHVAALQASGLIQAAETKVANLRGKILGFDDAYGAQYLSARHAFGALRAVRELRLQLDDETAQSLSSLVVVERQLRVTLKQAGLAEPSKERREPTPVSSAIALAGACSPRPGSRVRVAQKTGPAPQTLPSSGRRGSVHLLERRVSLRKDTTASIDSSSLRWVKHKLALANLNAKRRGEWDNDQRPPGYSEEALLAAEAELLELREVAELLGELGANSSPPQFQANSVKVLEGAIEDLERSARRLDQQEVLYSEAKAAVATLKGELAMITAIDVSDMQRTKAKLAVKFNACSIGTIKAMRAASTNKEELQSYDLLVAKMHFLSVELPFFEQRARQRFDATATLKLSVPQHVLSEQLEHALIEDIEDWVGVATYNGEPWLTVTKTFSDEAGLCCLQMQVLEAAGRPSAELLGDIEREATSGALNGNLSSARKVYAKQVKDGGAFEIRSVVLKQAHTVVHDARTAPQLIEDWTNEREQVKAELSALDTETQEIPQAQMLKVEGAIAAIPQCTDSRFLKLKERQERRKPLLQERLDNALSKKKKVDQLHLKVLALTAQIETMQQLGWETQRLKSKKVVSRKLRRRGSIDDFREYSSDALAEIRKQVEAEKNRLQVMHDTAEKFRNQGKELEMQRWKYKGGEELLEEALRLFQTESSIHPRRVQGGAPLLVAYEKIQKRNNASHNAVLKQVAREAAALEAPSTTASMGQRGYWHMYKTVLHMQPRQGKLDVDGKFEIVNEFAVEQAGKDLELGLSDAQKGRFPVLWLVIHYMSAPLPANWREVCQGKSAYFTNTETQEKTERHPLLPAFQRLARVEMRLQNFRKPMTDLSPEAWMEFVDASGTPYYYSFLSRQRLSGPPKLKPATMLGVPMKESGFEAKQNAMLFKARLKPPSMITSSSVEMIDLAVEMEWNSRPARAQRLRFEPLQMVQVVHTAQFLGIEPFTESHFMWIASAATCDTLKGSALPIGWEKIPFSGSTTYTSFYHNAVIGCSQWEHPALTHWRSVLHELKSLEANASNASVTGPVWVRAEDDI